MHPKTRDQTPAGWATLATLSVLTVIAVLVLATGGPAKTKRAAENCPADGGGGGGTPTPTGSPSQSPSMSGLPIPSLPLPTGDESETPTPSPSESGGAANSCNSTITIDYDKKADAFKGRVTSNLSDCEVGRKVVLNKDQPRPKKDVKVGTTATNPAGKWSIKGFEDPPGKYYAKVKKDTATAGGDTVTCKPAKSKTINP